MRNFAPLIPLLVHFCSTTLEPNPRAPVFHLKSVSRLSFFDSSFTSRLRSSSAPFHLLRQCAPKKTQKSDHTLFAGLQIEALYHLFQLSVRSARRGLRSNNSTIYLYFCAPRESNCTPPPLTARLVVVFAISVMCVVVVVVVVLWHHCRFEISAIDGPSRVGSTTAAALAVACTLT